MRFTASNIVFVATVLALSASSTAALPVISDAGAAPSFFSRAIEVTTEDLAARKFSFKKMIKGIGKGFKKVANVGLKVASMVGVPGAKQVSMGVDVAKGLIGKKRELTDGAGEIMLARDLSFDDADLLYARDEFESVFEERDIEPSLDELD